MEELEDGLFACVTIERDGTRAMAEGAGVEGDVG